MLPELFRSLSAHPAREELLDAAVSDDGHAVHDILTEHPDHDEVLGDDFFTPFLMIVAEQGLERIWRALTDFGFDGSIALVPPRDPKDTQDNPHSDEDRRRHGTPLASWAARALTADAWDTFEDMLGRRFNPWTMAGSSYASTNPISVGATAIVLGDAECRARWWERLMTWEEVADIDDRRRAGLLHQLDTIAITACTLAYLPDATQEAVEAWEDIRERLGQWALTRPQPAATLLGLVSQYNRNKSAYLHVQQDLVAWFVDHVPNIRQEPLERQAAEEGNWGQLLVLLQAGWPVERPRKPALMQAILDYDPTSPFESKSFTERRACFDLCMKQGPIEAYRQKPLELAAAKAQRWDVTSMLLDHGWPMVRENATPLVERVVDHREACLHPVCKKLIERCVKAENAPDYRAQPWELRAAKRHQWDLVKLLLDQGWPRDRDGEMALEHLVLGASDAEKGSASWQQAWNAWVKQATSEMQEGDLYTGLLRRMESPKGKPWRGAELADMDDQRWKLLKEVLELHWSVPAATAAVRVKVRL